MKNEHLQSGRKNQKQETRRRILLAAQQLLEMEQELTMENIAEQAGISRATIYRYYTNIDALSTELLLQLNVPDPTDLIEQFRNNSLQDAMLGFQKAYLKFVLDNENTSRKFLVAVLASSNPKQRGQNRISVVRDYFASSTIDLDSQKKKKLMNIAVVLMGIESIIATKDVCDLSTKESIETLQWGLKMIVKGCQS
ncbi:TetR/AcrR family transcriptional regulator [Flagellimonas marina]|uniref:TetR/AcrR family transcriptional regulator n=1 Tax=Flagellimonas marina TaxID=1775168 RepID=A0ABV8PFJ4_9FLAO